MSRRQQTLAERRKELVHRSRTQRSAVLRTAAPIVRRAALLDRVVESVRRYPVVAAVTVGAVALLGPRRIFDLGTRVLTLYALFKR